MVLVKWTADALKDLEIVDQVIAQRIIKRVIWLEKNFVEIVPERLHHELKGSYKLRVGDYRAVYSINRNMITIEAVGHRRNIYR